MRFVVFALWKEGLVGGNQRQAEIIGKVKKGIFRLAFGLHAVPLDLDITTSLDPSASFLNRSFARSLRPASNGGSNRTESTRRSER